MMGLCESMIPSITSGKVVAKLWKLVWC